MSYVNPNIFFRQNEFNELSNTYDKQYSTWIRNADNYFSSVNSWDTFNLMIFNSKYEKTFTSLLNSYLTNQSYVTHQNNDCNAFTMGVDEIYYFSIFQSEPLFYISIFLGIFFVISLFLKRKVLIIISLLLFTLSTIGNLVNYFIIEKDIIENIKKDINSENCEESIYINKFQDKYIELNKQEPYRYWGQ